MTPTTDLPELPLAEYQFNFQVLQTLYLPDFSGSLWHSVFGKALRDSVCITLGSPCSPCPLLHSCDYSLLFSAPRPLKTEAAHFLDKIDPIPAPHIMQIDSTSATRLLPKQTISLRLIVIGSANQKLQLIIGALLTAGINGLGKTRSKLQLQDVWLQQPNNLPRLIYQPPEIKFFPQPQQLPIMAMPPRVTLQFISTYRQDNEAFTVDTLSIPKIFKSIYGRVSSLQYFYTDKILVADFKHLKELAYNLKVLNNQLQNHAESRYSTKQQKKIDASGVIGSLELDLQGMETLWPYLYLGQWLNVGKNASMGFGRYTLFV